MFGNLFAVADDRFYRLDRHPTMARHPVTPMLEADLPLHLARQTTRTISLIDVLSLRRGTADRHLAQARAAGAEIIAIDALDDESLAAAGRLIWENRGDRLFAIGSQGLEYALTAYWRQAGLLAPAAPVHHAAEVRRVAAVSASCAPGTAAQIAQAGRDGFATLRLDAALAVDSAAWDREIERGVQAALSALSSGRDPLVFTALGPDDPAIARTHAAIAASGIASAQVNARIGAGLGRLLDRIMRRAGLTRGVVAGGDTSGQAAQALGIRALTALAPLAPGSPLCRAHGAEPDATPREFVFKGGQMGGPDFFRSVRRGTAAETADQRRVVA